MDPETISPRGRGRGWPALKRGLAALTVLGGLTLASLPAQADNHLWLDLPAHEFNSPGLAIPAPPAADQTALPENTPIFAQCAANERPAETAADHALINAGWRLFGAYQGGWGIQIIPATAGYDGMCRPWGYNIFVFDSGEFAGTVSPDPMHSRFDGAESTTTLVGDDHFFSTFLRYQPNDPLCCPSGTSNVEYMISHTANGPVVDVQNIQTHYNTPSGSQ